MDRKLADERKEMICRLMGEEQYVPMKLKELAVLLRVERDEREELRQLLEELLTEGKITVNSRGKYKKPEETVLTGIYISNARGFGFVEVEGMDEDLFISEANSGGAFHRDTVEVRLIPGKGGKRKEAEVTAVIGHSVTQVVGTYQKSRSFGFVVPDDSKISIDIFIPQENSKGAANGHKVVAEITDYGGAGKKPEGKILEILGHISDPGVDILSIVRNFGLPAEFEEKVIKQAQKAALEVSEEDMQGREDFRSLQMVTIDGEDAKDLDDAVSLTMEENNYLLGVHIADVANYVQENSALDREAFQRGTSVYLVDRVIPMLPHILSNGICSLNEGEDRLAVSCMMTITPKGDMLDYRIVESVIRVDRRMSYTNVNKILEEQDEEAIAEYKPLVPMFRRMEELAGKLRAERKKRGSIDFDFPESKILLDRDGHPLEIRPYERNTATKIIEDFMLIANETVAQHFYWMSLPFLYRIHDTPDPEKIMQLGLFINNFGYGLKTSRKEIHPKEIQKLLGKIEGTPEEALISRLALRSMKQAKYSVECTGHFGLACSCYCHFTSPIRRYPDLQVHRIIKDLFRRRLNETRIAHYRELLPAVADHSSRMERRADEAERETEKLKKAEYMETHIGGRFTGVISGVTSWGIYVELPNTVEGLIRVSDLSGDSFFCDEANYEMVGKNTGRKYKLGDRIRVVVKGTDRLTKTVDFVEDDDGGSNEAGCEQ